MATDQSKKSHRSLAGRLLVASPHADGSPYQRAVVLLLEHTDERAVGVLLDGQLRRTLEAVRAQLPGARGAAVQSAMLAALPVRVAMWEGGRLDIELASGLWMNTAIDTDQLFRGEMPEWTTLVREVGRSVYRDGFGITGFPAHPSLN